MYSCRRSRRWLAAAACCPGLLFAADTAVSTTNPAPSPGAAAVRPDTRSREQLFRDAFGQPQPPVDISAYVLLSIDGAPKQKVRAIIPAAGAELRIEGQALLALLSERLRPEVLAALSQEVDAQGWLAGSDLQAAGLPVTFEPRTFLASLATDPARRSTNVRYLSGAPPGTARALRPADVSGFLNVHAKAAHRAFVAEGRRASDVAYALDGAVNVRGVVLEGSGYGTSADRRGLQRGDVRLVHDRPEEAVRYSAGDLRFPVTGFQTLLQMGGVGVTRDFSLQPYRRSFQSGRFEFFLDRPAIVQVWVNASLVSTLQLPAGPHDIRGLSPAAGLNETRLVIEDAAGRVQVLDFSFISNPLLLEEGGNVFSVNAGYRRRVVNGEYEYDAGDPLLSAMFFQGIRADTTAGAYLQADRARALAGVQAVHGLASGLLQLDLAGRRTEGRPAGFGSRLAWTYLGGPNRSLPVQGQVGIEYLGAHFGSLNDFFPSSRSRLSGYGTLNVPLDASSSLQFGAYYTPAREPGQADAHSYAASWSRRFGRATVTLGVRHRVNERGEEDKGVLFGLVYSFSENGHNFYAAKETERDVGTVSWSSTRPSTASGPYGFASARGGSGSREYAAGAGYWTHQGLAEASHTRTQIRGSTGTFTREETSVRGQSALVFADGVLALTPQVAENFAIVRGKEGLSGVDMKINPDGRGGSRGLSAAISPAVAADLGSYRVNDIRVEPVDPPFGATPDRTSYSLLPGYKSGFLIELGKEARILAVGRLVDAKGQGVPHVPIEIRRLGDANGEPVRTFTGRTGGFQVPEVRPGRYEVTPTGPTPWNTVILDIPASADGLARLGDIAVGR